MGKELNQYRSAYLPVLWVLVIGLGVGFGTFVFGSQVQENSGTKQEEEKDRETGPEKEALESQSRILNGLKEVRKNRGNRSGATTGTNLQELFFQFERSAYHSRLKTDAPSLYGQIEKNWVRAVGSYRGGKLETGDQYLDRVIHLVDQSRQKIEGESTPAALFVNSFIIIMREGVEAILIVAALIGVLLKMGREDETRDIYLGVGTAVIGTVLLAVAAGTFLNFGGKQQELLEGFTMLLAMIVLFSVSHWLVGKIQAERWMDYIKDQVKSAGLSGNRWALFSLSFLVVFREGFETVLFYAGLAAKSDGVPMGLSMIGGGILAGMVLLVGIYVLVTRYGVRMPMKTFFTVTGILLYLLAFKFAGDGIAELQEAGYVYVTVAPWIPDYEFLSTWFGINGTWEAFILQAALVLCVIVGLIYHFIFLPVLENWIRRTQDQKEDSYQIHKQAQTTGMKIFTPTVIGLFLIAVFGVRYVGPLSSVKTEPGSFAPGSGNESKHEFTVPHSYRYRTNSLKSTSDVLQKGKNLYKENCQVCHGEQGKGNGVAAGGLKTHPRDFTDESFMNVRSDTYLFYRISEGKAGTAMPAFRSLSENERWAIIHYIRTFARSGNSSEAHKQASVR